MCLFALLNRAAGLDIEGAKSQNKEFFEVVVQIFLNSVGSIVYEGKINAPFWDNLLKQEYYIHMFGYILIHVVWVLAIVIMFIILCNFMISYISQSYEDVLEMRTEDIFNDRCQFNQEYQVALKVFTKFIGLIKSTATLNFNCFLLTSDFKIMTDDNKST